MATGEICQCWKDEIAAQAIFPLCPELDLPFLETGKQKLKAS
jgi:hypothetical protein